MFIWENQSNKENLLKFRELIINYYNNTENPDFGFDLIENEEAQLSRTLINISFEKFYRSLIQTTISPSIFYSPPRNTGGLQGNIDVFINIFNLYRYKINPSSIIDITNRAIGIYEDDKIHSILRTINPFFYLGLMLEYVASFPFKLLGKIGGFNSEKLEATIVGKILKAIIYSVEFLAALLTVIHLLGYLDDFKAYIL